jgi:hypothetical protein
LRISFAFRVGGSSVLVGAEPDCPRRENGISSKMAMYFVIKWRGWV